MKRNLLKWTLAGAATALLLVYPYATAQTPGNSSETVDLTAPGDWHPFPHFWENMFGAGRANLSLRDQYRADLRAVKQATGFTYIRFHGIFDDENGVYSEDAHGKPVYNFSYVDQIYDGLLENGVKPFVELSFMPEKLAANLKPHPFWYKPFPSPPQDPAKWSALMDAFTRHLVDRYGKEEVESWYFEVWNEPNLDFWNGDPKQQTYFAFYDTTARAIKAVDEKLRIGGPATAQAAWVSDFISHCLTNRVPFDFVSTHVYGNDNPDWVLPKGTKVTRRGMVAASARKVADEVHQSGAPQTPIVWSEYNATYMNQTQVTDSAFMGPWLANNIRECDGLAAMMSYWAFSDVFEEQGVVKTPFYGGYGILAERGIPKPAFRAFELLHLLGDRRRDAPSQNALVTKRPDGTLAVALWNYAEPTRAAAPKTFTLKTSANASLRMRLLDPEHGSPLPLWNQMGKPGSPTMDQIRQLRESSKMPDWQPVAPGTPIQVPSQGLALVEISGY